MSGLRFTLVVDNEVQLDRALSRFGAAFTELKPFFNDMVTLLEESVARQFSSEGGNVGGWAPLSPRYAMWKAAAVGAKPILQLTGAMRKSFKAKKVTNSELHWGSTSRYAPFHQRGTSKMPARKIIHLASEDRRRALKELQKFVVRQGYPGHSGL